MSAFGPVTFTSTSAAAVPPLPNPSGWLMARIAAIISLLIGQISISLNVNIQENRDQNRYYFSVRFFIEVA
jgi:hypothetical protein